MFSIMGLKYIERKEECVKGYDNSDEDRVFRRAVYGVADKPQETVTHADS